MFPAPSLQLWSLAARALAPRIAFGRWLLQQVLHAAPPRSAGVGLAGGMLAAFASMSVADTGATQVFNEVHTIAAPTTGVPQEYSFSITTAGTYTVTLTDLGAQ